jgi:hypothetical protein
MTVADLIELARKVLDQSVPGTAGRRLAIGIIDQLGEAQPCGMEAPNVWLVDRKMDLPASWCESAIDADEARSMARLLLRAADLADAKGTSHG